MNPAATISGLEMAYGDNPVLRGVDLELQRGEVFALLGPNGAGKTTMVEILEGFRRPGAGEVTVLDEDPATAGRDWRSRIGIVLQQWTDHPDWRAGELLGHIALHYSNPLPVEEVLELVQLTAQADQRISSLSGGQRRRLDVGIAIVGQPELLFLDEPTTGFDPQVRRGFWSLIERLADGGTTVLLTTHYLDEADHLADRIGVLISGRMAALGTPRELSEHARLGTQVRWTQDGEQRVERTQDPSRLVFELHQAASAPIPDLEIVRPTLEDFYLDMLRSEEVAA